jgi:hypothetical protein
MGHRDQEDTVDIMSCPCHLVKDSKHDHSLEGSIGCRAEVGKSRSLMSVTTYDIKLTFFFASR